MQVRRAPDGVVWFSEEGSPARAAARSHCGLQIALLACFDRIKSVLIARARCSETLQYSGGRDDQARHCQRGVTQCNDVDVTWGLVSMPQSPFCDA